MRLLFASLLLLSFFILLPVQAHADYLSGQQAYDAGNFKSAFQEWDISAKAGDANSQFELGKLYEEGLGTIQNFVQAHMLYNLAASQGNKEAREARNAIARKMGKDHVGEAQELAAQWQAERSSLESVHPAQPVVAITPESLFMAVNAGDVDQVKKVLDSGLYVNSTNSDGHTALMASSSQGHETIVRLLIAKGADLNLQDNEGLTALMNVSFNGDEKIVRMLIEKGADLNLDGNKALIYTSARGYEDTVRILIKKGVDVNLQDNQGFTALMGASANGREKIVRTLIAKGADLNLQDENGLTALILASARGHKAVVRLLKAAGATK